MRLPQPHSISSVPQVASTKVAQQQLIKGVQRKTSAKLGLIKDTAQLGVKIWKTHAQFQSQEAFSKANSQMRSWEEEFGTKEYFKGDEIPEGIDVKTTETVVDSMGNDVEVMRERIPAYEVYPQMRSQYQRKVNSATAKDITSSSARAVWSSQMDERSKKENHKIVMQTEEAQNNQIRDAQNSDIKTSLMGRDYESAMLTAQNYHGSDSERKAQVDKVKYIAEFDTYNSSMSTDNMSGMKNSLEVLQNKNYKGSLNEVQRLATINQLKSKIGQNKSRTTASHIASVGILGYEIDSTINDLESGKNINPEDINRLYGQMDASMKSGSAKGVAWEKRKFEFNTLVNLQPALAEFRTINEVSRDTALREMRDSADSWEDHYKVDLFESADKEATKALREDPLAYAEETGIVKLKPLEIDEGGRISSQSLKSRVLSAEASDSRYGKKTQTDLFTNSEMGSIVYGLNQASDNEKLQFVSDISSNLSPEQATRVWSQLASQGGSGYAILGDMISEQEVTGARMMLTGQSVIKNNPEVLGDWDSKMKPQLLTSMGNAFSSSPETRGMMMQGIKDVYAGLSMRDHDLSGEYNEARMKEAQRLVVGNTYQIGGSTIPLPERSMQPDTFDIFLRDMDVSYVRTLGGIDGYDSVSANGELKDKLRNGEILLIATGKNQYVLFDAERRSYLRRSDNKSRFILSYDENADQRSRWQRGYERAIEGLN